MHDIVIIGGGASGLACAVAVCERAVRLNRTVPRILILEAADKIGRSILRSGNGRCNFSNAHVTPKAYRHPLAAESVFAALEAQYGRGVSPGAPTNAPNPVVGFFEQLGLVWREEAQGRLYPLANKASVVLDVLRTALARFGVDVRTEASAERVVAPQPRHGHFTVHLKGGELVRAHRVVLACGGASGSLGLEELLPYTAPMPVLGPLATDDRFTRPLDNIRVRSDVSLLREGEVLAKERGEVQFRKYGVSGIAVFNLSRFACEGDVLRLDLAPQLPRGSMLARKEMLRCTLAKEPSAFELLQGIVLPLVADQLLRSLDLEGALEATDVTATRIEGRLHAFDLSVKGIGDAGLCQVSRGGFSLEAFCLETMEAKEVPGLYGLGEALDMDAGCGGFNLHWAFATGMLAAGSLL